MQHHLLKDVPHQDETGKVLKDELLEARQLLVFTTTTVKTFQHLNDTSLYYSETSAFQDVIVIYSDSFFITPMQIKTVTVFYVDKNIKDMATHFGYFPHDFQRLGHKHEQIYSFLIYLAGFW